MYGTRALFVLAGLCLSASVAQAFPDCGGNHCSKSEKEMNDWCVPAGLAGRRIPVYGPDGKTKCTCPCSCTVGETLILQGDRSEMSIASMEDGSEVATPIASDARGIVDRMMGSDGKKEKMRELSFSNGKSIKVSANHTFVRSTGKITSAEKLAVGDTVRDAASNEVTVKSNEAYLHDGRLYNLIVNNQSTKPVDHVIVNNGIQSGDWRVQTSHDTVKQEIDLRLGKIPTFSIKKQ